MEIQESDGGGGALWWWEFSVVFLRPFLAAVFVLSIILFSKPFQTLNTQIRPNN